MSAMHFDCAKRDGNHLLWYSMGEYYDEIKKVLKQAEIPEEKSFFTEAGEFFDNTLREYQEFQSNPAKWRSSVQGGEKEEGVRPARRQNTTRRLQDCSRETLLEQDHKEN